MKKNTKNLFHNEVIDNPNINDFTFSEKNNLAVKLSDDSDTFRNFQKKRHFLPISVFWS